MSEFERQKQEFLDRLTGYIAQCGQITPYPEEFIDDLEHVKAWAETANRLEWAEIQAWWAMVRSA